MRRLNKLELLEGIEDIQFSRIVAHNTVKYKKTGDDDIYIRFYDTDIIVFHSGHVVLNSGKHKTVATKNRINEFQNVCCIIQVDFRWYVTTTKGTIPFFDGMKINNDGAFIN